MGKEFTQVQMKMTTSGKQELQLLSIGVLEMTPEGSLVFTAQGRTYISNGLLELHQSIGKTQDVEGRKIRKTERRKED